MKALLHSVFDQPDAAAVHAQFDRILDALTDKLPAVAEHLEWTEMRRYIGLDVLKRARLVIIDGAQPTNVEEVTPTAISA